MFGPQHYVPVLKCKQGEKRALANLAASTRAGLTPLVEIVELGKKALPDHLATAVKGLAKAIGTGTCFLDTRELEPQGPTAAVDAFAAVDAESVPFVPVTGITRTWDVAAALAYRSRGVCIRLTRSEFEDGILPAAVRAFLAAHQLREAEVDLVLDLGEVNNMVASGGLRLVRGFLATVPSHTKWRSMTVVASSFPKSMGIVPKNGHRLVDRVCWETWRLLHQHRAGLSRLPTFGDVGVQHPSGVEGFDPRIMHMSASIRYTSGAEWLLIKGQSTKQVRPSIQFPALAKLLVPPGPLSAHFRGPTHCAGCQDASAAAAGKPGRGSMTKWREIGTAHHLTTVREQIAGLPWP